MEIQLWRAEYGNFLSKYMIYKRGKNGDNQHMTVEYESVGNTYTDKYTNTL